MKKELLKRINNKLGSRAGETISETLVALLISALALTMLAGSIAAASRMINTSRTKLQSYYDANECLVKGSVPSDMSSDVAEAAANQTIEIKVNNVSVTAGGTVNCVTNKVFPKNQVTAYTFDPD